MSWNRVHAAWLSGIVLASSAAFVRADCDCAPAPCAPAMRTVTVTEWVPEKYETTRTVYHQECVQEHYTAYRTECTPVQQEQDVTVYKSVCETHNEMRTVCKCVPCEEERTVMKEVVTCVPETTYVHHCVDHGHYECREVECGPTLSERFRRMWRRNDCCECECECPHYRTEKVWVPCMVDECCPVTHMCRHVECVPCVEKVCTFKQVEEQVSVPVTCFKCVPCVVHQCCTVWQTHCVPYDCCRTVTKCVPSCETVTCCRMAPHCVEKQVPCCETPCCESCCDSCCEHHTAGRHGLFFRD